MPAEKRRRSLTEDERAAKRTRDRECQRARRAQQAQGEKLRYREQERIRAAQRREANPDKAEQEASIRRERHRVCVQAGRARQTEARKAERENDRLGQVSKRERERKRERLCAQERRREEQDVAATHQRQQRDREHHTPHLKFSCCNQPHSGKNNSLPSHSEYTLDTTRTYTPPSTCFLQRERCPFQATWFLRSLGHSNLSESPPNWKPLSEEEKQGILDRWRKGMRSDRPLGTCAACGWFVMDFLLADVDRLSLLRVPPSEHGRGGGSPRRSAE